MTPDISFMDGPAIRPRTIGRSAEHQEYDFRFRRTESPARKALPFEKEESMWKSIAAGICLMFALAVIIVVTQ